MTSFFKQTACLRLSTFFLIYLFGRAADKENNTKNSGKQHKKFRIALTNTFQYFYPSMLQE
jgi:hypothetical protein